MDTSETYIKMCDCPEIQGLRPFRDDYYCELREGIVRYGDFVSSTNGATLIWLPRQDQLQIMVGDFDAGFIDWWYWRNAVYPHMQNPFSKEKFTSFEQLWLAFVMKEKFNKVWDGEKWNES